MKKKIPFIVYLFFILVYANQGLADLPGQCIYYITRETWHLSATMLGLIGFVIGLAWYIKPIFGIIVDRLGALGKTKNYLLGNTLFIILACMFIIMFGLNLWTLIILFTLINFAIAGNDVANDKDMCILEKKHNLKGRIQCFDEETEILTNNGWKNINTINKKDKVLSLNQKTNVANYYPIKNIFKYNYKGKIYRIKNKCLDFIFSPNHRIFYKKENTLIENNISTSIELKEKNYKKHTSFLTTFKWKGKEQKTIVFKSYNRKGGTLIKNYIKNYFVKIPSLEFLMDDWLEFLGWYLSEGCFFNNRKDQQLSITQTKIKNRKEIKALLDRMRISFWESKSELLFNSKQIKQHINNNCYIKSSKNLCYTKKVPDYVKYLSARQINIFLKSFNKGDGWKRKSEEGYCTTSKKLADDLQELILKTGSGVSYSTIKRQHIKNHHDLYIIHRLFSKSASFDVSTQMKKEEFKGRIWDVETEPHHLILIRRRGRIIWTGNSIQWTALGIAGLFVSIIGALIADKIPEPYNYKVAYGIMLILPVILFIYLTKYYQKSETKKIPTKINWQYFKNKEFLIGILFILFLRFSPSFGKALMIKMREVMLIDKMFIGYLGATGTVLGLLGYILYYWKGYKLDMKKLLYFAVAFSGLTNLCYLWIPNKWVIFSYSIIFGAFDGIAFLTILAFIAKIVPTGNEAFFYALVTSVNNLSARLGGVAGGWIYDQYGYAINVIVASITTLACLFFIPHLYIRKTNNVIT